MNKTLNYEFYTLLPSCFPKKAMTQQASMKSLKKVKVNKALIYYHFENKRAILDSLIDSMMNNINTITLKFANDCVGAMIEHGVLTIQEEQFLFADHKALEDFTSNLYTYYKEVVDYTLDSRAIVRILMFESLKGGKHQSSLFRFMELLEKRPDNVQYRTMRIGHQDFNYHEDTVFYEFFFSIIPLVSIAAYYDEYQAKSQLSDEKLRELALQSYLAHAKSINAQKFIVVEP